MRAQLMAIAFLLGCGGGGVDISTDQNNVCDQVAEVACHNAYQCCSEGEIERLLNVTDPRSEDECRSDISRRCVRQIAALDYGIDQKHVRFDSNLMNDCLNALVAPSDTCATIASTLPWTMACMNSAWIGLVDDGGACLSNTECSSKDSFCGSNQTCIARPTEGQACGSGCASGFFCATTGTCHAKAAAGGACTSAPECADGLSCDTTTIPGVCVPLRAPGEKCTSSASCTSAQCNPGTCVGSTATCLSTSACVGVCGNSATTCLTDSACGTGTCSAGGAPCFTDGACGAAGAGGTCVFPVKCNHPACVGNVCADKHLVVDYCQAALSNLPVP